MYEKKLWISFGLGIGLSLYYIIFFYYMIGFSPVVLIIGLPVPFIAYVIFLFMFNAKNDNKKNK